MPFLFLYPIMGVISLFAHNSEVQLSNNASIQDKTSLNSSVQEFKNKGSNYREFLIGVPKTMKNSTS